MLTTNVNRLSVILAGKLTTMKVLIFALAAMLCAVSAFLHPVRPSARSTAALVILPLILPIAVHAKELTKSDFLAGAAQNIPVVERSLEKAISNGKKEDLLNTAAPVAAIRGVRLVDLGGNRGAVGLAASSDTVIGGSLIDQLKKYGGPGSVEKVDSSIMNPFKQSNSMKGNAGISDQIEVFKALQGK